MPHRKKPFSVFYQLTILCLVALYASPVFSADDRTFAFLRRPDIHGDLVVFSCEGDLWLGSVSARTAVRLTNHPGLESWPRFSPDGNQIAFTGQYDGGTDVYVMSVDGGSPRRLTWDPFAARVLDWTPDGASVLFRSRRQNGESRNRLWSVPARGGIPRLLPIPQVEHAAMHRDGRRVAYVPITIMGQNWKRYHGGRADEIWLTDLADGSFRTLTSHPSVDTTPVWAGDDLYFVSERTGQMNLYLWNTSSQPVPVTRYTDYPVRYPASDGNRIVFEHGDGLALYQPGAEEARELVFHLSSDRIHTRTHRVEARDNLQDVALGPTGQRVLLEARGQILSVPVEEGSVRRLVTGSADRARSPAWSSDGKHVAFVSDRSGEERIYVLPSDGSGEPRLLDFDHTGPLDALCWSPNGEWISVTDRENRLMLVDVKTGAMTLVDQSPEGGTYNTINRSLRFSPDSKYVAFDREEPNETRSVYLYGIKTGEKTRVTSPLVSSYGPAWDPSGKYLYLMSDRTFAPRSGGPNYSVWFENTTRIYLVLLAADTESPFLSEVHEEGAAGKAEKPDTKKTAETKVAVKVDRDGIEQRIVELPMPAGAYSDLYAVEGRLLVMGLDADTDRPVLRAYDMKKARQRTVTTIASGVGRVEVSANGKKLLLQSGREYYVVEASTGPIVSLSAGRIDLTGLLLDVNPVEEWAQIFHEGWRVIRDFFYDPNLHGLDWAAVRARYAALLPAVGDRSELNEILGEMLGELGTGHAYVGGGDLPNGVTSVPMGFLAADLEPVDGADACRVARILDIDEFSLNVRSPLREPGVGVQEGDYILAVAGQRVRRDQDIQALLVGTAGRLITITVNSKPEWDGAREVHVRPLASESEARYVDWVEGRRRYLREYGGDNLGYIHLPDMGNNGLAAFARQYYPLVDRDGLVFDVRNNGGGWVAPHLILHLTSRPTTYRKPRYGNSWTRTPWVSPGHKVAVCNGFSSSNAEDFVDLFQRLDLGPVVGTRTWGGLVGSGGGWTFVDGGRIQPPNYGAWSPQEGWIVEGPGAVPDMLVEQDPAEVMAGRDPQLDAAIAILKERIAKDPVERPSPPPFPVISPPVPDAAVDLLSRTR